jgi:hypothetical protein
VVRRFNAVTCGMKLIIFVAIFPSGILFKFLNDYL